MGARRIGISTAVAQAVDGWRQEDAYQAQQRAAAYDAQQRRKKDALDNEGKRVGIDNQVDSNTRSNEAHEQDSVKRGINNQQAGVDLQQSIETNDYTNAERGVNAASRAQRTEAGIATAELATEQARSDKTMVGDNARTKRSNNAMDRGNNALAHYKNKIAKGQMTVEDDIKMSKLLQEEVRELVKLSRTNPNKAAQMINESEAYGIEGAHTVSYNEDKSEIAFVDKYGAPVVDTDTGAHAVYKMADMEKIIDGELVRAAEGKHAKSTKGASGSGKEPVMKSKDILYATRQFYTETDELGTDTTDSRKAAKAASITEKLLKADESLDINEAVAQADEVLNASEKFGVRSEALLEAAKRKGVSVRTYIKAAEIAANRG